MKSLEKSNSYVHRKPSKSKDKAVINSRKNKCLQKENATIVHCTASLKQYTVKIL